MVWRGMVCSNSRFKIIRNKGFSCKNNFEPQKAQKTQKAQKNEI
jgi:hypothetical protein